MNESTESKRDYTSDHVSFPDILNVAFVEMGAAYKKWHCAAAERARGLNSMTNLSPRIILFNLPWLYVFDIFATLSNFELNGQF